LVDVPGPVSALMGDRPRKGKPPRHRTRHPSTQPEPSISG